MHWLLENFLKILHWCRLDIRRNSYSKQKFENVSCLSSPLHTTKIIFISCQTWSNLDQQQKNVIIWLNIRKMSYLFEIRPSDRLYYQSRMGADLKQIDLLQHTLGREACSLWAQTTEWALEHQAGGNFTIFMTSLNNYFLPHSKVLNFSVK